MITTGKHVIGIDVGGANLKYAGTRGEAVATIFPLWRHPERLADAIASDLARLDRNNVEALAVTMTGELADCFADREIGVQHIVAHVCEAASRLGIDQVLFYGADGQFRDSNDAVQHVDLVAAANWHALAGYVAQSIAADATLVDIGSTTTDIIPISAGRVATSATTDYDRLQDGSLVYVGCRRTPVCALVDRLRFRGRVSRVMNELFATIDDARLILGTEAEDLGDCDSCDEKPRTGEYAANRMARMIGLDRRSVTLEDAVDLALQVTDAAKQRIRDAMHAIEPGSTIVLSGHGHDLIELPNSIDSLRLTETLGSAVARCAPSYAVATLYRSAVLSVGSCDV